MTEQCFNIGDMHDEMRKMYWALHSEMAGEFSRRSDQEAVMARQVRVFKAMQALDDARSAMSDVAGDLRRQEVAKK